jgi:hypothetical protein
MALLRRRQRANSDGDSILREFVTNLPPPSSAYKDNMDLSAEVDKPMDRIPAQHVLQTLVSSSEQQHHDILNYARNQMANAQARFDVYAASKDTIEPYLEHVCEFFQGSGPWHLVPSTSSLTLPYRAPCCFVVKTATLVHLHKICHAMCPCTHDTGTEIRRNVSNKRRLENEMLVIVEGLGEQERRAMCNSYSERSSVLQKIDDSKVVVDICGSPSMIG